MTIQIIHNNELAEVLEVNSQNKLDLKVSTAGNVTLTKTAAGLQADVTIPEVEAFDPSELNQKIQELETAKAAAEAKVQALEAKVQQLEAREDIKLTGASLDENTNELTLTLEGGQEIRTSLAKFVDAPKSAEAYWDEIKAIAGVDQEIADMVKDLVKQALKGEEVQNLAGQTKGYLLSA